jgi:hypothetical protein
VATLLRTDRIEVFEDPPAVVWARLADVQGYPVRWPMIRRFDARGLVEGDAWSCSFRSPLGLLHVGLVVGRVDEGSRVEAEVHGDIEGEASIELVADGPGTRLRLASTLAGRRRVLRMATAVAPPLSRWSHDRVISRGLALLHARPAVRPKG